MRGEGFGVASSVMVHGVFIEACVDSQEAALAAIAAGANRLELCDFRVAGGVTPDLRLVEIVTRASPVPVHVLVRPRDGNFVFPAEELAPMIRVIDRLEAIGVHGVVTGALTPRGAVDRVATGRLLQAARPLSFTFHRAFDAGADPHAALETLIELGVDRVLTSGHAPTAEAGISGLATLVRQAADRIGILAGGGIRGHNVARIVRETGVREIHSRGDVAAIVRGLRER